MSYLIFVSNAVLFFPNEPARVFIIYSFRYFVFRMRGALFCFGATESVSLSNRNFFYIYLLFRAVMFV